MFAPDARAAALATIDAARVANTAFLAAHPPPAATGAPALRSVVLKSPDGQQELVHQGQTNDHVRAVAAAVDAAKTAALRKLRAIQTDSMYEQGMTMALASFKTDPASVSATAERRAGKINYRATVSVVSEKIADYGQAYVATLKIKVTALKDGSKRAWRVRPTSGDWLATRVRPL